MALPDVSGDVRSFIKSHLEWLDTEELYYFLADAHPSLSEDALEELHAEACDEAEGILSRLSDSLDAA